MGAGPPDRRGARLALVTDACESPLAARAEVLIRLPREAAGPIAPLAHQIAVTEGAPVANGENATDMALTCEFLVLEAGCCDAGGIHAVCFACSGAGGIGECDALLQCGSVEV